MLLRNLNPAAGLLNGTRLSVLNLDTRLFETKFLNSTHAGDTVFLPIIPSDAGLPFNLKRRRFPIRPTFSITINKAQGQSLGQIGLDLTKPVFSHGQLYVAFPELETSN
ncbi:uncharacterized protein LOC134700291 [Mytilus trossulus]|uniref:uncharacterized protein LOC134700291 n=1 Tax=Mytilus trossulus TaxID=6551 RepID=UPI003004D68D